MKKAGGLELWAHRGMFHGSTIAGEEPLRPPRFKENTIPALRAAANNRFAPELDLMATADKPPRAIVAHGDEHGRLGTGAGALPVNRVTLEELQEFGLVAREGERELVPTFEQFLDSMLDTPVRPNVELKGPDSATAAMTSLRGYGVADYIVNEKFLFSSFEPAELVRLRSYYPNAAIALLLWSGDPRLRAGFTRGVEGIRAHYDRFIRANRICALHVDLPLAEEGVVNWAAELGCTEGVRAYTCNSAEQAIELRLRGIEGIFTDFPEVLYEELS